MWIQREIEHYWNKLCQEYPIILVTGSRQVGKTSLLEHIYGLEKITTLDLPRIAQSAETNPELFLRSLDNPGIIDEVQYAPALFRAIKWYADTELKRTGSNLFLTGSERFSLMSGVSESLAGRVGIIELGTLALREIEQHTKTQASGAQLLNWLIKGGYPGMHARSINRQRFFSNLVATYIERDVKRLISVRDSRDFDRFLRMLALRTGQLLSMSSIASDIGVSQTTIKRWLSILQASAIVDLIEPWHANANKRLIKTPKIFFNDTGLCTFLAGINSEAELQSSPLLGSFFETLCYIQIKRHYQNQGINQPIYFFRTRDGDEVDFILPNGQQLLALECKFSEHPTPSLKAIQTCEKLTNMKIPKIIYINSGRDKYSETVSTNTTSTNTTKKLLLYTSCVEPLG